MSAAAVPVVQRVGAVRQRLRGCHVAERSLRFRGRRRRRRAMVDGGHGVAAGRRHRAGGLHSCKLLLLIGTAEATEAAVKCAAMLLVGVHGVICVSFNSVGIEFPYTYLQYALVLTRFKCQIT